MATYGAAAFLAVNDSIFTNVTNEISAHGTARNYAQLVDSIETKVDPPSAKSGTYSEKELNSGLLYQAAREYFYNNYYAVVRVTNMGQNFAIITEFSDPEVFFKL